MSENDGFIQNWYYINFNTWIEQFRNLLIEFRQIGYDWQLNKEQKELWQKYYEINLSLVEYINHNQQISSKLKEKIKKTVLLPQKVF